MSAGVGPNAAERLRWNDEQWIATWLERQALTAFTTEPLLDQLAPAPGERVLEIGSGTGRLSETLARRVGPQGGVVGVDLSEALTSLARARAAAEGLDNLSFVVADAQVDVLDAAGHFDAATSQFGVMFFEDRQAAFANLARHLVPGGRLAFVTWRRPEENPWYVMDALAPYLEESRRPVPGATTGPFSMADSDAVVDLLHTSGWKDGGCSEYGATVVVERAVLIADVGAITGVAESDRTGALRAMESRLDPFLRDDGRYEVPLAFQVFTAGRA